ncbi:MAG: diguanylate cyclase [Sulfuritalea sp.]|nr:diguanylate cyclase [Sulfuritalea sp.]
MSTVKRRSLKTRVTLFTLVIFLIGVLVLALYGKGIVRESVLGLMGEQQFFSASVIASGIDQELDDRLRAIESISKTLSPAVAGNTKELQAVLEQRPILKEIFNAGSFVTDIDGVAMASFPRSTEQNDVSLLNMSVIASAIRNGKTSVGQFIQSKNTRVPMIGMATPIRDSQGKLIGVLVGLTDLNKANFLEKFASNYYGKSGGYLFFSTQHRLAVAGGDKGGITENHSFDEPNPLIDSFFQGKEGYGVATNSSGVEVLASAKSISPTGWFVVLTLSTDEALAPFHAARKQMLLVTIILAALGGGLIWLMLRHELAPTLAAVQTLATQSKSDLPPQPLAIVQQDEIGDLIAGFNRLLTTLNQREESLRAAEAELRIAAVAFESQDGMVITDSSGKILRVNKSFTEITGYSAEEAIGQTPALLKSGRHDAQFYAEMWERIHRTGSWQGEIWDKRKNGEIYPKWLSITAVKPDDGAVTHYVGSQIDITERKATEDAIRELAFFDALTKLPNRRLLNDRLSQSMAASKRSGHYCALMFLDLDNFKPLNDEHGHAVGDLLLIEAANRIKSCVREMDTVARFGGDEFVVILNELNSDKPESTSQAGIVADKIRSALSTPYRLAIRSDGKSDSTVEHHCTASIGVVMFINHDASHDDILRWADAAMYHAKDAGRNSIRFFDTKA